MKIFIVTALILGLCNLKGYTQALSCVDIMTLSHLESPATFYHYLVNDKEFKHIGRSKPNETNKIVYKFTNSDELVEITTIQATSGDQRASILIELFTTEEHTEEIIECMKRSDFKISSGEKYDYTCVGTSRFSNDITFYYTAWITVSSGAGGKISFRSAEIIEDKD